MGSLIIGHLVIRIQGNIKCLAVLKLINFFKFIMNISISTNHSSNFIIFHNILSVLFEFSLESQDNFTDQDLIKKQVIRASEFYYSLYN